VGEQIDRLLAEAGVPTRPVPVAADVRQNLALTERETGHTLHLVFPGSELSVPERQACVDAVLEVSPAPRYVVLSGSLPPGVPDDFYADLAKRCAGRGSRVLLDTGGPALKATLGAKAPLFLVKPNRKELEALFEFQGERPADYLPKMESLLEQGAAEAVVMTMGGEGALLGTAEHRLHLRPPRVEGRAPVGAGDSFVSALVQRLAEGGDLADAARHGVAAAAAAVKTRDPQLYRPEDLEDLRDQVTMIEFTKGGS
jgi:6-phosphofructokinase 2